MLQCNMSVMATATRELIEIKFPPGKTLAGLVSTRRRQGIGWRRIADEVTDTTGVPVSFATIRRWFPDKAA